MMRLTLGTAAGLAAVVMLTLAFWPQGQPGSVLSRVVAQDDAESRPADATRTAPILDESDRRGDAELQKRLDFDFLEVQLNDALAEICDQVDLQFHIKTQHLEDLGVSSDAPVSLSLRQVSVEMALDLILEPLELTYIVRDGVILVTTEEDLDNSEEVRVYNCRDLLAPNITASDSHTGMMGEDDSAGGFASGEEVRASEKADKKRKEKAEPKPAGEAPQTKQSSLPVVSRHVLAQFGGGGASGGFGGGMSSGQSAGPVSRDKKLMDIIMTAIVPDSWEQVGGPGTIAEFDGLIVIRHNPRIHRQVEQVLKMLREASGKQPWINPPDPSSGGPTVGGGGGFF